jgi:four helix bundle protein
MEITSEIHQTCLGFPKYEMYGLCSQMNRASVSIPSNIAEGSNREMGIFPIFKYRFGLFF